MATIKCEYCGQEIEQVDETLPEGWIKVDYDVNKYTPEIDQAVVCSTDCEVRLATKFAAGGLR